jgi:hypothetical protein
MIAHEPSPAALESGCTPTERRNVRRYQIELAVAVVAYVGLLFLSLVCVDRASGALKVVAALLPMVGIAAMMIALVRFTLRMDEFQRQTLIVSGAIAAIACAVATMALGFLENAGVPRISMTWVWPMMAVAFGIALPFVRRRFR